jgi:uncharacterized protein (DUF305 family)
MKLNKHLTTLILGGFALLPLGFLGCTNPSANQAISSATQDSMPGMDHSAMNMSIGPDDVNFDLLFIDAMTPHHEGGLVMAQEALQKSKRPEIKQLAQEIIDAQKQEIAQLKDWRKTWYPSAAATPVMNDAQIGQMMPMSEQMRSGMMMEIDLGAADEQFDLRFINAMIPHHEAALPMAKEALEKSDRPEIKQIAQEIIDLQQKEIDQLKQWLKAWYKQ